MPLMLNQYRTFVLASGIIIGSLGGLQAASVTGLDQLANFGTYTNADAATAGYGINALGAGYFVSEGGKHVTDGDSYEPILTFSDLVVGQEYSVTILVGNYTSYQQSFNGFNPESFTGLTGWTGSLLQGPVVPVGSSDVIGYGNGGGQAITWRENVFTFTATATSATANEYQNGDDTISSAAAASDGGYLSGNPGVREIAIGGISIAAIPEPSSVLLVGFAGMAVMLRSRRR